MNYISYHVKNDCHLRLVLLVALEVISVVWFLIAEIKNNKNLFKTFPQKNLLFLTAGKRVTDRHVWFLIAEIKNYKTVQKISSKEPFVPYCRKKSNR
jgi:hypothetical protein